MFVDTMRRVLDEARLDFEFVFVNDGSEDETLTCLMDAAITDARIRIVNLSRNFGKELALTAGIDHAIDGIRDLLGQVFLNLQTSRIHIDDTGDL